MFTKDLYILKKIRKIHMSTIISYYKLGNLENEKSKVKIQAIHRKSIK